MNRTICILTTVHDPFDHRVFFKEARALQQTGYRIILIAPHTRAETVHNIEVVPLPSPRSRVVRMIWSTTLLAFKALSRRADAYHFHDPEVIPVAVLLKLFGYRVIYDVHEDVPRDIMLKDYIPGVVRRLIARVVDWIEQAGARRFDAVVVATEDIRKNFAWHPRITLVRNLPLLTAYDETRAPRAPGSAFTLVYAGNLVEIRGITQIVQAMAALPKSAEVRLLLCGAWDPVAYEAVVRSLPGFVRTNYLGKLPVESIPLLLSGSDAGLVCFQPTRTHVTAMPTKMFEYMAAGLPVIASNFPLWREIVEKSGAGICVDPTDPDAIAGAILRLFEDPVLARKMGEQGRRVARVRWSWESEERALTQLYCNLLGAP